MNRNLVCIICPRGCQLSVKSEDTGIKVLGNLCPRGEKYAIDECTAPVRNVTSTIRINNRDKMVSVKTKNPIAKNKIFDLMKLIRQATVSAPIKTGDVIINNVFGTDIVATKTIE